MPCLNQSGPAPNPAPAAPSPLPQDALATPAVPSALRPNAPPSMLRVPDRLVTTTAAGVDAGAGGASPLAVPEAVSGTADPFWRELLRHIEGADSAHGGAAAGAAPFLSAFQQPALGRLLPAMPAGVLTALVTGLAAPGTPPASKLAYLRCLEAAVLALAAAEAEAAGDDSLSASQRVWQPRGAPLAASLAELCREPLLLSGLQATAADGNSEEGACARAASAVAAALLGGEAGRAAVAAAARASEEGGGGGAGLREQLEALAQQAA